MCFNILPDFKNKGKMNDNRCDSDPNNGRSELIDKLEVAWKLILDQYSDKAKSIAKQEGPGVSIFRLLKKPRYCEGSVPNKEYNCEYYYAERGGNMWNDILKLSTKHTEIEAVYNPDTMVVIMVQIPTDAIHDDTFGNIRVLTCDTMTDVI